MSDNEAKITVTKNGPYIVAGSVPLDKEIIEAGPDGIPLRWGMGEKYPLRKACRLCRCGASKTKPYCDNTHLSINFDGTETAGYKNFSEMNDPTIGPDLIMNDAEKFCAVALFCHRAGDAWNLTEKSSDPEARKTAIQEAFDCPSGRLVAADKKTGQPMEPEFEPSISVVEDRAHMVSGPLWVKGGVPIISAEGKPYETRNRVTLCRCSASKNKPFCDGSHCNTKFNDGDERIKK